MSTDRLAVARAGIIEALGLIECLKTAHVTSGIEGTQAELNQTIAAAEVRFQEILDFIDNSEEDSAPNCGARNR